MMRLIYSLIQDHGIFGAIIANIGVTLFCFWKLFTNHLKHMDEKIDTNHEITEKSISAVKDQVTELKTEVKQDRQATNRLSNRVSKMEGQMTKGKK